jgi:hypothetical protein
MVYLKEMNLKKRGAKFKTKWKGPYEVIRRLSDLNYLVKMSRSKEIVVNVNKMKSCFRKTASRPTTERRRVRDTTEDKRETLETYETRNTGPDAPTNHSDTNTKDVTGNSTQDMDSDPFSRTRTFSCGDAEVRGSRSTSPTNLVVDRTAERYRDVGNSPKLVKGGGTTSKSLVTELAESENSHNESIVTDTVTDVSGDGENTGRYYLRPRPGRNV